MDAEFDYDLATEQWEALKMLRLPAPQRRALNQFVVEDLIALHLAAIHNDSPILTSQGRKVLIRGSSRLWDVAA
jgi:hypothetical protein